MAVPVHICQQLIGLFDDGCVGTSSFIELRLVRCEKKQDAGPTVPDHCVNDDDGSELGFRRVHTLGDSDHVGGPANPASRERREASPCVVG